MKRINLAMVVLVTSAVALPVAALAASAFDGTWKVSLKHIRFSPKPDRYILNDGAFTCVSCNVPYSVKADGMEHKVKDNPEVDAATITIVDPNTVTATYKLGGKVMNTDKFVISADGQTLEQETQLLVGAAPSVIKARLARVSPAPAGAHALSGAWRPVKVESASGPDFLTTYSMSADGFTMSSNGLSYSAKFDDKTYPITGDPAKTMVNLKKVSDTEVLETDSRGGKAAETVDLTVAADGKTIHVKDTLLRGNRVTHYDLTKTP
jgi:hypothetical protein